MNKEYWDEVFKLFTGRTHDIHGERYADVLEPEIEEMIKDVRNKLSAIIDVCGKYWSHNLETIFVTSFYEAMYAYNNLAKPQEEIDITGKDLGRLAFKFDQLYCDGLVERCGWSKELSLPEAINKCNEALKDKSQLDFSNVRMIK